MVGAEAGDSEEREKVETSSPRGPAGALFRGDALDDKAARLLRVDLLDGEFESLGDEVLDGGVVDQGWIFEFDMADLVAASFEVVAGVAEAGAALEEEKADPAGKERNGEDGFGGPLGGAESNGEGVVVVVDEFDGAWEAGAHPAECGAGLGGDFGGEFVEEAVELGGGGGAFL